MDSEAIGPETIGSETKRGGTRPEAADCKGHPAQKGPRAKGTPGKGDCPQKWLRAETAAGQRRYRTTVSRSVSAVGPALKRTK
jgi:hypothetical protein